LKIHPKAGVRVDLETRYILLGGLVIKTDGHIDNLSPEWELVLLVEVIILKIVLLRRLECVVLIVLMGTELDCLH